MTKRTSSKLQRTVRKIYKNYRPPADMTVSEWAEEYRVLSKEHSAEAGPWRNDRTPYLVEIMDAFTDPKIKKLTLVASSQIGKSEMQANMLGYIIDQDPGGILYIHPTVDDARKFSRQRIATMIRDTKKLRGKVSEDKSRSSANTILQKTFPGGTLTLVGSNAPSGLASMPIRYVFGDERDRWATSAGTEGDPWKLAEARTTTFYNAKMVDVSTPTIKGYSPIESSFLQGTQELWSHQCPHCGDWHSIEFDNIKFDFDVVRRGSKKDYVVKDVTWCCPSCGALCTEAEMRKQPAKWIAENETAYERGHRSFWLNAFASPWVEWKSIVYDFLSAKDDPEKLKVVYNTKLGKLWEDRGELPDDDEMLSKREDYGHRKDGSPIDLPEGVLVLTCGVDTQDNRLEYEVVGHGHYGEKWGIKKGIIMGDPHYDEVWERLDEILDRTFYFEDKNKGLSISMTFVDSGGHKTQDVYLQCAKRMGRRVFAVKGQGGEGIPYTKPPSKVDIMQDGRSIGKAWLYVIGVDAGKAEIMNSVKVQEPGSKYYHFPNDPELGYDAGYFRQLVSEKLIYKNNKWVWEKILGHERNEGLDIRNYANAAYRVLDPNLDVIERRLKGIPAPEKKQKQRQPKKPRKRKAMEADW